jgi:DNA (cytosine-5)-methyltransferase 1
MANQNVFTKKTFTYFCWKQTSDMSFPRKATDKLATPLLAMDLFCGCGGFSYGFQQAGIRVAGGNDIWAVAGRTFKENHPDAKFICGDIRSLEVSSALTELAKKKGVNVLIGGPPCQAYSMAGARDVDDERGRLFESYVSLVKKIKPAFFVMENVSGILTMRHNKNGLSPSQRNKVSVLKGLEKNRADLMLLRKKAKNTEKFTFSGKNQIELDLINGELITQRDRCIDCRELVTDKIMRSFTEIGYKLEFRLLNAADYGAPQKRERVIFIGTNQDCDIDFPESTHCDPRLSRNNGKKPWKTVRQAICDLEGIKENALQAHWFTGHSPDFVRRIKETPIGSGIYGGYSDAWYRNPPDEPSRTVKENHGGVLVHYARDRVMTPRELARLQTFPDKFIFEGSKEVYHLPIEVNHNTIIFFKSSPTQYSVLTSSCYLSQVEVHQKSREACY